MSAAPAAVGAVDIGGTKIAVGLVDGDGRLLARADVPTGAEGTFDAAMAPAKDALAGLVDRSGRTLDGIGIGATGPIDVRSGAFGRVPFFPHWEGGNPVTTLGRAFGVSAVAENDADAAALGEAAHGAGRDARRFLFVTVGTGIGGGFVIDGRLYRGAGGAHPEVGHQIVEASGPPCTCGGRGCWEALAAGPAMADWYLAHAESATPAVTARDVCERARHGDAVASAAVERQGYYLGVGLASLITVFAPDLIALGGSVMGSYDLFAPRILDVARSRCTLVPWEPETIRLARLGTDAGLIGAAEAWRHHIKEGRHHP